MKSRHHFYFAIVFISLSALWLIKTDSRKEYERYLEDHQYHPSRFWNINVAEIPKKDRPDLAWQQNYLMTMDPELRRPAPERLSIARKKMKEYFGKAAYRTGTEQFPWVERGPDNVGGRTRALTWDPNDADGLKVWAGGVTGGLWFTNNIYDEEAVWLKVDDFWANISITSIAFDPTNTNIMYVGTGEGFGVGATRGAGIWKSEDGGTSWSQLTASADIYYVNDLVVRDESGTGVVYAATRANYYEGEWHGLDNQGLLRSTDGGLTFHQVMPLIPEENIPYAISDIELAADNSLWVGSTASAHSAGNRGGGSILFSKDGTSWTLSTQRTNASRVELACARSNPEVIYALIEGGNVLREVLKTTDSGNSWTNLAEPNDADSGIPATDFSRSQAWYDLILAVDPNDENVVLSGAIDLFKSTDGGNSWNQISHWWGGYDYPYVHADQHAIVFKPGSSSDVVFGHDGGVDLSTNMHTSSPSFTNRNNNYNVTQFYACAIHPDAGKDYFLAGSQDNGTQRFNQRGLGSTYEVTGGDGAFCFIDQNNGSNQITSYVYNSYYLSTNGGASFTMFEFDGTSGQFSNPSDYDDHLGILYTAANAGSIGRFTGVKSGSPVRSDFNLSLGAIASHLRVSPHATSSTTLFVGTTAGRLFKVTGANNAPHAVEITGDNFPTANISCVEIGSTEDDLLVTFSNYGVSSVFESKDGGASWVNKEGDLPDMPVRWALYNPEDANEVILATDLGVWRTTGMQEEHPAWIPSNIGLANVRVDMLQLRNSDYEVVAATHGRGLYSSSGFMSDNLRASFAASSSILLVDGTVNFADYSPNASSWSWSFEGGMPSSSTEQNPSVSYTKAGTYSVSLTVTDSEGNQDTKTINEYINVRPLAAEGCGSIFSTSSGTIEDGSGSGNYANNLNCTWIIQPSNATSFALSFEQFRLEEGWDFLFIYNPDNLEEPVASLTGNTLPPDIIIDGRAAVVVFQTDESVREAGWKLSYTSDGDVALPNAPSSLETVVISYDQIDLSWIDHAGNETGYLVERSEDNSSFTEIHSTTANATKFSDKAVKPETTYYYRILAYNHDGRSDYSNIAEGTTPKALPKAPSGLLGTTISSEQIDLSWTDNANNEEGYTIERSEDGSSFIEVHSTSADIVNLSDTKLNPETTYYYRVRAYNNDGVSDYSDVAGATTLKALPESPTSLTISGISFDQVDLSWTDNSVNENGFFIERSEESSNFKIVDTVHADVSSYSDTELQPETTYSYRVKAFHEDGESAYSNTAKATTLQSLPEMPDDLLATPVSYDQVELSWLDNSHNESGFVIERSLDPTSFTMIESTAENVTSYKDTDLEADTKYYYRIKAKNESGSSAYADVVEATTFKQYPDIAFQKLHAEQKGLQLEIAFEVLNEGDTKLEKGVRVACYLSDDDKIGESDFLLAEYTLAEVPAGSHEEAVILTDIPEGSLSGDYYMIAVADDENSAAEKDELNNVSQVSFKLVVLGLSPFKYDLFNIYPIPARETITIESLRSHEGYSYTISDISGRLILGGVLSGKTTSLDVANAKIGTYNLILKRGENTLSFTVLKY